MTASGMLTCHGDTYPVREKLRARGWKWNSQIKSWTRMISQSDAVRAKSRDADYLKSLGLFQGCRIELGYIVIWQSKTYQQPAKVDNDIYNCDGFGNRVHSRVIPGSAPDDLM